MEKEIYKHQLERVYKTIYCDGKCEHYDECRKGLDSNPEYGHVFYQAKYGAKYEQANPRVLFVGKESTDNSGVLSGRNLEEPADVNDVPNTNTHYFGTIYTAAMLLKDVIPSVIGKAVTKRDVKEFSELRSEFCLTNYYKCAFKKSADNHGVVNSKGMKRNCYKILIEEIKALRPKVVIMQGKFSNSSFWRDLKFGGICEKLFESDIWKICVEKYCYEDSIPFYVVWSYHPSAIEWNQSREDFIKALQSIPKN